jgi:hypothetical protein
MRPFAARACRRGWVPVPEGLVGTIDGLLARAEDQAVSDDVRGRLAEARNRLGGPLRLAIAGKVKAGKSTLLNALLGEELAPTDAGECTKIVTWYVEGNSRAVVVHPLEGPPASRPWTRDDGAIDVDLGDWEAADVDHIEVRWPTTRLHELTVLDTPGIASISTEISERTHRVLSAEDDRAPVADAVLYLMRHTHASDVRFLEAFHDDELAHGTPVNSVGVLSRADEIGSCRLDALEVAARIALRYEADPRLRRLCPVIVPVDGLLAFAAVSLREAEFAMIAALARAPEAEMAELLLTVDRFVDRPTNRLTQLERAHLLDRFGLFGVRLAVALVREGTCATSGELAETLAARSGLDRLRTVVLQQFLQRSRILRARSALSILRDVLRTGGCTGSGALEAELEQISAGTHEFEEVRQLAALRSGQLRLSETQMVELDLVLGGSGHDAWSRLNLPDGSSAADVRAAALTSLERWQRVAEHPLSDRAVQTAARTARRALEGIVADLPA